jgi:hypothetical protein
VAVIKKVVLLVLSGLAIGCTGSPVSPTEAPQLRVENLTVRSRNTNFRDGDSIRIAVWPVSKNDDLRLCYEWDMARPPFGIMSTCNHAFQPHGVVSLGTWYFEDILTSGHVGTWTSWAIVNGQESNRVTYTVR